MKIIDLKEEHPELYALAILRQAEAGNKPDPKSSLSSKSSFIWEKTKEGIDFWHAVASADFEKAYKIVVPDIPTFTSDFHQITASLTSLLEYKNEKYGNSALEPLKVFSGKSKLGTRMDDKLARVKNNPFLQKNDIADCIGYLVLICKENGWTNFDEFKD